MLETLLETDETGPKVYLTLNERKDTTFFF